VNLAGMTVYEMNVYIIRPGNYTGVELAPELQRAIATSTNWKSAR